MQAETTNYTYHANNDMYILVDVLYLNERIIDYQEW